MLTNICDDYFKVRICLPMQEIYEILVWSMSQEDPLEKEMATHSGSLFFFLIYILLKGNCFTEFCCFLSNLNSLFEKCKSKLRWNITLVFLPERSHGQRSLAGYSPWGCKELDLTPHTTYLHAFLNIRSNVAITRTQERVIGGGKGDVVSCSVFHFEERR